MRLTAAGIAAGLASAWILAPLSADLLYRVSPRDGRAFGAAAAVLAVTALAACLVPALRATRITPADVLREN